MALAKTRHEIDSEKALAEEKEAKRLAELREKLKSFNEFAKLVKFPAPLLMGEFFCVVDYLENKKLAIMVDKLGAAFKSRANRRILAAYPAGDADMFVKPNIEFALRGHNLLVGIGLVLLWKALTTPHSRIITYDSALNKDLFCTNIMGLIRAMYYSIPKEISKAFPQIKFTAKHFADYIMFNNGTTILCMKNSYELVPEGKKVIDVVVLEDILNHDPQRIDTRMFEDVADRYGAPVTLMTYASNSNDMIKAMVSGKNVPRPTFDEWGMQMNGLHRFKRFDIAAPPYDLGINLSLMF